MKFTVIIIAFLFAGQLFAQNVLFDEFLEKGKAEFKKQWNKQNYAVAVENLEKAVKLQPGNAEAHYFLGYAYDRLNAKDAISMNNLNINLTLKASREYEKTIELQPEYKGEILVLDPYSRLTSIWGSQAISYLYQNKSDSAKWCFREGKKRGGFGDFFLAINRKTLDLCSDSAFLFTMGDNVTIPMWYLQTIENYKGNVRIIDANLLNTQWYPHYLIEHKIVPLPYTSAQLDTLNYCRWDSTEITIDVPKYFTSLKWTVPPSYAGAYLLRSDRLLLDILKRNKFVKDVYFSSGFNPKSMLGLRKHLRFEILADKLLPGEIKQLSDEEFYKLADEITSLFKYVNINSQDNLHFIDMFRYIILDRIYMNRANKDFNLRLLVLLDGKVPASKFPVLSNNLKGFMKKLHEELK
jgi:hypothetical protein